ncbi:glutamate racemase [Alterisphingorhabdus coralli]|uniref:Glutamate racemase n=1 Tax=Alterisphingorhabdus coralli TaxID=3071408 RepID=A0AA97F7K8_9SPHN|nr:glutamate racemase [Parasphingorhabdus sp. SCSIO 66989]WOE73990.1 glutamate racemase [Parasphingorhabdus sp. SCSIO 66989]
MTTDDQPLLLLDTGVGALSIYPALRALLPTAPVVYAADYAGLPYGTKTEEEIATRVPAILGRLVERYAPQIVTIACNTASTIALDHVRAALSTPVVGTVPAIKPAAEMTRSGVIGILGTQATVRQPYVDRLHQDHGPDTLLLRHAAPDLVEPAEAKIRGERVEMEVLAKALAGLREQPRGDEMDIIVLACTHFPLLREELASLLPDNVALIDGAEGIARRIVSLAGDRQWPETRQNGVFVTTGDSKALTPYHSHFKNLGFTEFHTL